MPDESKPVSCHEPSAIDEIMEKVFRERLNEIEANLIVDYPARATIIRDAFDAHRESRYNIMPAAD
ncbi:hypothetical protein [Candidatus Poriferisocius sp.]|uniref:hypothetical protein n=1 Tax=Candidatus Poriferisocius sp. TaxID=3101276 RepID=UPI003B013DE5